MSFEESLPMPCLKTISIFAEGANAGVVSGANSFVWKCFRSGDEHDFFRAAIGARRGASDALLKALNVRGDRRSGARHAAF
jgi:hypothetical protein